MSQQANVCTYGRDVTNRVGFGSGDSATGIISTLKLAVAMSVISDCAFVTPHHKVKEEARDLKSGHRHHLCHMRSCLLDTAILVFVACSQSLNCVQYN